MILVDANILIYSVDRSSALHESARTWLEQKLNGAERVGLPWQILLAYLRIVTNPRIMARPATMAAARAQVRTWLESEVAWIPAPGDRHIDILDRVLALPGVHGNLVMDAHLAALAIEHGLEIQSTDSDFARFPSLRWVNPFADGAR